MPVRATPQPGQSFVARDRGCEMKRLGFLRWTKLRVYALFRVAGRRMTIRRPPVGDCLSLGLILVINP